MVTNKDPNLISFTWKASEGNVIWLSWNKTIKLLHTEFKPLEARKPGAKKFLKNQFTNTETCPCLPPSLTSQFLLLICIKNKNIRNSIILQLPRTTHLTNSCTPQYPHNHNKNDTCGPTFYLPNRKFTCLRQAGKRVLHPKKIATYSIYPSWYTLMLLLQSWYLSNENSCSPTSPISFAASSSVPFMSTVNSSFLLLLAVSKESTTSSCCKQIFPC